MKYKLLLYPIFAVAILVAGFYLGFVVSNIPNSFGSALNISTVATSTFPNGIVLSTGCFYFQGSCVGSSQTLRSYSLSSSDSLSASGEGFGVVYATSTALAIPAGFATASSTISVKGNVGCQETVANGGTCSVYLRDATGTTLGSCTVSPANSTTRSGLYNLESRNQSSTSSQVTNCFGTFLVSSGANEVINNRTTSAIATASALSLVVVIEGNSANASASNILIDFRQ